eukprot:44762_1
MALFWLCVASHVILSSSLDSVTSIEIQISSWSAAETVNPNIYVTLWFDSTIYQTSLSAPQVNTKYTKLPTTIGSYCSIDMPDTKVMIENDDSDAMIIDWIKFTTSSGTWYGVDAVCAPIAFLDRDGWLTAESNCGSTYTMDEFCIDNENTGCGPAKQIYYFDTSTPDAYISYARRESGVGIAIGSNTCEPTNKPSTNNPSNDPTTNPSHNPTNIPTERPSKNPTNNPSNNPSNGPTNKPTNIPSNNPIPNPTRYPSINPSNNPSNNPTNNPTNIPTYTVRPSDIYSSGVATPSTLFTSDVGVELTKMFTSDDQLQIYVFLYAMGGFILCIVILICVCAVVYCRMGTKKPQKTNETNEKKIKTELEHKMKSRQTNAPASPLKPVQSQPMVSPLDEESQDNDDDIDIIYGVNTFGGGVLQHDHNVDVARTIARRDHVDLAECDTQKTNFQDVNDFEIMGDITLR